MASGVVRRKLSFRAFARVRRKLDLLLFRRPKSGNAKCVQPATTKQMF
jgi:hypothetical protein